MSVGHWDASTAKRVFRELRRLDDNLPEGFTLEPTKPCDLSSWRGTFPGPVGTPYEAGTFEVEIQLPAGYWQNPPRLTFLTKVWHPNVSSTNGSTCLFTTDWSGAVTLPKMLLCAHALLHDAAPDVEDGSAPHDTVVAAQYANRRDMFERTARDWTRRYAKKTPLGAFVGDHNESERYFAPDGWGEGELGESANDLQLVKYLVLKAVDKLADDTRGHLRAVLRHVDAHTDLLPENAYLCIANELKRAYDSLWPRLSERDDDDDDDDV
jgi:ubiquitin-conjugating enzyme (huntingtin interacting protein 2)